MGCVLEMVVSCKLAVVNFLLDTAIASRDRTIARHFVQRALNAMVGPGRPGFKRIGMIVRNPVHGMVGKGVLSDLSALRFARSAQASRSAHKWARQAVAAKDLGELRRCARKAKRYLHAALRSSVPAGLKAIGS